LLTSIKMKKDLMRELEIPEGITVNFDDDESVIVIKKDGKELTRRFDLPKILLVVKDGKITISSKKATKRESKLIGTTEAHIKNMFKGLAEDFVYKMEVANVHFPMTVKIDDARKVVSVKSFLGETTERVAKIVEGAKVDIKGSEVTITSHNIEAAGQTAGNIEKATRLTGRDRRVFQDGIFITEKPGRKI
jgi:large subunit ribosomal protein L6